MRETKNRYCRVAEEGARGKKFWIENGHRSRDVTHRGRRHRRPTLSISVTVLAARRLIDDRRDGNDISWNAVVVADHVFSLPRSLSLSLPLSVRSLTPFSLCISDFFPSLRRASSSSLCSFLSLSLSFSCFFSFYIVSTPRLEINAIRFLTRFDLFSWKHWVYDKNILKKKRKKRIDSNASWKYMEFTNG